MKKILPLFILLLILSSCGTDASEEVTNDTKKKGVGKGGPTINSQNNFNIDVKNLGDFASERSLEKVGTIISDQSIEVSSQVSGKLKTLYVKEGQEVKSGQPIAAITDLYSKYYLDLQKAQIDYDKQIISKESQLLSLDKKITDTKISLQEATNNLENAKKTAVQDKKKAAIDYENSDLVDTNSQAYLELEKAKLDYQNTIENNTQQLQTYIENVKKEYNNISLSITDIIKFSDELLGVTYENREENDAFENFLGAEDRSAKSQAEDLLIQFIEYQKIIQDLNINNLGEGNIVETMDEFYDGYDKTNILLNQIEVVLNKSIPSAGTFSNSDIDNYISRVNSFQSSNQNNLSSFSSTKSSITTFLNTYKNKELSALRNVEIQEKKLNTSAESGESNYEKILISIDNTLSNSQIKFEQAQSSYNNAMADKQVSIKSLNNAISGAKNSLDKSRAEYSKLTITSPISGVVSSINTDLNSDVSNGTNIMTVVGNNNTQVEVSLNSNEINEVSVGDTVSIDYQGKKISGSIYSKSQVAGINLEYRVIIHLSDKIDLIGGSTIVSFSNAQQISTLPLSIITITQDNRGFIYYLNNDQADKFELELGKINGEKIEILNQIPADLQIITTDLKKYNPATQTLLINSTK